MRPVESVVESKTAALDENQIAEQNGPLAGLSGVLPSEPGLGFLRKPPAYSTKLQVSDGQHRYAATLERLIAGETNRAGTQNDAPALEPVVALVDYSTPVPGGRIAIYIWCK